MLSDLVLKTAIPDRLLKAKNFSEGLAAVEESEDASNEEQTELGLFEKKEEKKPSGPEAWGYILPSGKLHIPKENSLPDSQNPKESGRLYFSEAGDFLDGRAAVRPLGGGASWMLIDSRGKVRTTGQYTGLVLLGEARVAWKREAGWGLMDFQEKSLEISPGGSESLQAIGPFGSERAPAKDGNGLWGFLDPEGKWVISPKFERAGVFRNGLAPVREPGGKWGFLRPDGSWGIEPKFSRVQGFSDGLAAVSETGEVEPGPEPKTEGRWP